MDERAVQVEVQIWYEAGEDEWRCRVITPHALHTVRLHDRYALSAYISSQIALLLHQDIFDAGVSTEPGPAGP